MTSSYVSLMSLDDKFNDIELGRIVWDGQFARGEGEKPLVDKVLAGSIVAPVNGKNKRLTAADGLEFVSGLKYQYKSPYLRATEIREMPTIASSFVPPRADVRLKASHETKDFDESKHPRGQ